MPRKPPKEYCWKKGQSGNPRGASKKVRMRKELTRERIDAAMTDGERDLLIEALRQGVLDGDPQIIRLVCEYRWGKPEQKISIAKNLEAMSDDELLALSGEAIAVLNDGDALLQ